MGYRGKLRRRQQARLLRATGLPLAEIAARLTGIPASQFGEPYRALADPSIRRAKHMHGCVAIRYSCSATHRSIMWLVRALLNDGILPG